MAFHEIQWYDRNPRTIIRRYFADNVAPHGLALRWDYTVPPNKKAFIEHLFIKVRRFLAGAPEGRVTAYIQLTPVGEAAGPIAEAGLVTNNVGDHEQCESGHSLILVEGDSIACGTSDSSTGGGIDYRTIIKITEFDAYLYVSPPKTVPQPMGEDVQRARVRPDPEM